MKIGRKLNEKGASYHTCQLQQQRAYKVFIRFLHSSNLPAEVKEAIEKHEHQVRNVVNVRHWESKVPLPPLFFVDLESNQNNKDICKLDRLLNAKIQIELPKKNIQLYNVSDSKGIDALKATAADNTGRRSRAALSSYFAALV